MFLSHLTEIHKIKLQANLRTGAAADMALWCLVGVIHPTPVLQPLRGDTSNFYC